MSCISDRNLISLYIVFGYRNRKKEEDILLKRFEENCNNSDFMKKKKTSQVYTERHFCLDYFKKYVLYNSHFIR